jgi:threonine synthase
MDLTWKTSALIHLECPECGGKYDADQLQTICHRCHSPLLACYDLDGINKALSPSDFQARPRGIWRWAELLPLRNHDFKITLGEGDTPIIALPRLGKHLGLSRLYLKDESRNPTGTFKARGLSVAVSRAIELGAKCFVMPTAGNAGAALASYATHAGCMSKIFMPHQSSYPNQIEVQLAGAHLVLVDGSISKAATEARAAIAALENDENKDKYSNWFDMSTFKEPYRLEGKKTMGLEIAEFFGWQLPELIIYPTGGGTGLVGMWKAFEELNSMGWINERRPRMVVVQSDTCPPIVHSFHKKIGRATIVQDTPTIATGLRVPEPFADRLILNTLYSSQGFALVVSDEQIKQANQRLAHTEGILAAHEGAATLAALILLIDQDQIKGHENILLVNTGSGLKNTV